MRVSREQMQANRQRILEAAGVLFREKGFEAVTVAEVMKAAGLTHGGFYGHFTSKDDLVAQALTHVSGVSLQGGGAGFDAYLDDYLSPAHRDAVARGCPTAALAAETRHQAPGARTAMTEGLKAQIDRIAGALPDGEDGVARRRDAVGVLSTLVGALILARAADDGALSDEILASARAWIEKA